MGGSANALRAAAALAAALRGWPLSSVDAVVEEEVERPAQRPVEPPPAFFDYDCDLVGTSGRPVADWDDVYARAGATVAKGNASTFEFPAGLQGLVEGPLAAEAEEECPLGVLYLLVLSFYDAFLENAGSPGVAGKNSELMGKYQHIQGLLGRFPVYAIALSRWPVFYAMEHFGRRHEPMPEWFCDGERDGVIDWAELRALSEVWAEKKRGFADSEGIDDMERTISDRFFEVLKKPASQQKAQEECLFGFYFLIANQVVAAANRETHHMPPFNSIMDTVMSDIPFIRVAACGWPIFAVLAIFSDLNKGLWFFGGDRKYLRGYSDWNLRRDELSPLVPSRLDFLSPAWRTSVGETVDALAQMPAADFAHAVRAHTSRREELDGPLRPIVRGLVDAALAVAAAATASGNGAATGRRLVYVVLLYGERWAKLLARLAGRLRQLGVGRPLLVIAIGTEAAASCKALAAAGQAGAGAGPAPQRLICWTPDSQSQVHRFTAIHALLHLGVDVFYLDMDTFLLRDPTPRVMALAEGFDALFARHADADCINIGVFFLRARGQTAIWMSQFLAWYHDHPFEIDQRGLHVFLRLPAEQLRVAYPPSDLVEVRAGVLDDVNEVVIGDVGWCGELSKMLIFHWCHRPLVQKEEEIAAAYDAADAAEAHGLALAAAITVAARAQEQTPWLQVLRLRAIFEEYQKEEPPVREACW